MRKRRPILEDGARLTGKPRFQAAEEQRKTRKKRERERGVNGTRGNQLSRSALFPAIDESRSVVSHGRKNSAVPLGWLALSVDVVFFPKSFLKIIESMEGRITGSR